MGCRTVYGLPLLSRPFMPAPVEIGHSEMSFKESLKVVFVFGLGTFALWVRQLLANLKGLQTSRSYSQPASPEDNLENISFLSRGKRQKA